MIDTLEKRPDVVDGQVRQELRDLIQVVSWIDEQFAEEMRTDRVAAITALVARVGMDIGDLDLNLVGDFEIPESPMGASPSEVHALDTHEKLPGPGTVNSYTADCGCSDTTTGGCSCGSVFGTPCLACATVLLC